MDISLWLSAGTERMKQGMLMDEDRGISGSGQTSESHVGHILEFGSYFEGSGVGGGAGELQNRNANGITGY